MLEPSPAEEEEATADPLPAIAVVEEVVMAEAVVEAVAAEVVEAVEEVKGLPQLLALPRMAMEDQMGASKAILPLFLMGTDQKANNS